MPRREIGLMGYVGRAVIAHWLQSRFPLPRFEVAYEIRPTGVPAKGGPYLDICVLRDGRVDKVFEVKSQDYIFDGGVNPALAFLWRHRGEAVEFTFQNGRRLLGHRRTEAYLVLLVPPNKDGIREIRSQNLRNVVLFRDLWPTLPEQVFGDPFIKELFEDVQKVLAILRSPSQGPSLLKPFVRLRGNAPSVVLEPSARSS